MKVGLAVYPCVDGDLEYNLSQIEKGLQAAQGKADLLCFGEAFLQGFNAFCWQYEQDKHIAISADSPTMARLCSLSRQYQTDLLFGYLERDGEALYSSCAVIANGELAYNYRRVSKGWKEYTLTDGHYREGSGTDGFLYRGHQVKIALCGDLWDFPERFRTEGLLLWPIYVNFSLEDWAQYEQEYAQQAALAARKTLMVNPISRDPEAFGGAFCFQGGHIERRLDFGQEGILTVEVESVL